MPAGKHIMTARELSVLGGKARQKLLTPSQRRQLASKAAKVRWSKRK